MTITDPDFILLIIILFFLASLFLFIIIRGSKDHDSW
jgi:hypothetical protein